MISFALVSSILFYLIVSLPVPHSTVILLPDADGKVGQAIVTNNTGSQTLNQAYTAIEISNKDAVFAMAKKVDKNTIQEKYKSTLSSQPDVVSNYILYFISGSNELTETSKLEIPKIIADISARKTYEAYIVGHTDTVGSSDINYKLGLERATVLKEIVEKEFPTQDQINVISHGEGNLLVQTMDKVAEPKNRRVEIEIH